MKGFVSPFTPSRPLKRRALFLATLAIILHCGSMYEHRAQHLNGEEEQPHVSDLVDRPEVTSAQMPGTFSLE